MRESARQRGTTAAALVAGVAVVGMGSALAFFALEDSTPAAVGTADLANLTEEIRALSRTVEELRQEVRNSRSQDPIPWSIRELEPDLAEPLPEDIKEAVFEQLAEAGDRGGRGRNREEFAQLRELQAIDDEGERLARALELIGDENAFVKMTALQTLIELSPADAAAAVREMAESDDRRTQGMLPRAIAMLGEAQGVSMNSELYRLYDSESGRVRGAAARALEAQGDDTLIQRELAQLTPGLSEADGGLRLRAVEKLGDSRSPAAAAYLLPMLADSNSEVRFRTLEALRRTASESAIEQVQALLDDPVAHVRDEAARTLKSLREPDRGGGRDRGFGGRNPVGRGARGGRGGR